jgi:DNA-binding CsgD family transcriptional regulator
MAEYDHSARASEEVFDELPEGDPAREIITTILELVPVSHWSFARFKGDGDSDQLLSSTGDGEDFSRLKRLFKAQRHGTTGPRIAATVDELAPYSSGLTLLFADNRANFGILTLLRTPDLGPFSSSEIRTLTFALDAASERLSTLRLFESEEGHIAGFHLEHEAELQAPAADKADSALYILDRELSIVLAWSAENERRIALTPLRARLENRLPPILEEAVRELTSAWTSDVASQQAGAARPVPFLVVRTQPLSGPAGLFIGVSIERSRTNNSLTEAAAHFHISPREIQVLALLLDGAQLEDVARRLHIASSTVQDHIKSLLRKTRSRNRSELIAKVLRQR